MKYLGVVSYYGKAYSGFQRQRNGLKSIQGELERALSFALGKKTLIKGAGRTDAGVNALGQTFTFDVDKELKPHFIKLLNHLLPQDISVTRIDACPPSFDARHSSVGKVYEYRFSIKGRDPFQYGKLTQLETEQFDKAVFEQALRYFEGEHDFQNFTTKAEDKDAFVRTIEPIEIIYDESGNLGRVIFKSNGFMTYQIRLIMGVCFKAAMGRIEVRTIPCLIDRRPRHIMSFKAPPDGLYLKEVLYGN